MNLTQQHSEATKIFEDNLLNESKSNEGGLLICEIDVFRKHAEIFKNEVLVSDIKSEIEVLERNNKAICTICKGTGQRPLSWFDAKIGSRCRLCNSSGKMENQALSDYLLHLQEKLKVAEKELEEIKL